MRSGPPLGPGGRMVKSSKPSSDSWLASSTVLTTLYSNGISATKHRASSGQLAENSDPRPRPDDGGARHAKEEPVFDDAGDLVERPAERGVDVTEARVENQVAVVRLEWPAGFHPELRPAAEGLDRASGRLPQEGQHLDRDPTVPQPAHQLALVGDEDEASAGVGDDLLSKQSPASPLEAVDRRVDLVGTVDGEVERPVDSLRDRDPTGLGEGPAFFRRRDRSDVETASHHPGQPLDEVGGGAAGPEPDDAAGLDQLDGALGGGLLLSLDFGGRGCHLVDR